MEEPLLGVCRLRSLGNRKDDRKAGINTSPDFFFSVTSDKKILVYDGTKHPLEYQKFDEKYKVVEPPTSTIHQRRMKLYKGELNQEKLIGHVIQDLTFKVKQKGKEETITFKKITRSSAVKTIIREFKSHEEIYEWFRGDWLLIKKGDKLKGGR